MVRDVPVPGGFVRAEVVGDGPPLILLHAWTLDRRIFAPQLPLARRMQLVLIERRGFGQSSAPPDLAREPDDVLAVANALEFGRFAIAGLSQGGRVAIWAALKAPARIAGLVLMGAPLDGLDGPADPPAPVAAMRAAAAAGDRGALAAAWAGHPFLQVQTDAARALVAGIVADYDGHDLLAEPTRLPVSAADLAGLRVPVTAMAGALDTVHRRAAAAGIAAACPAGRLLVIERAGHLCNCDRPEIVNAALEEAICQV
jgi:pimeloyl-ACP methyl ester carboxylesterase